MGFFNHLYYSQCGDSAGSTTAVSCIPKHLGPTCGVDFGSARDQGSYLDPDLGTTIMIPGTDARSYTFSLKITTSTGSLVLTPTAIVKKSVAGEAHTTVFIQGVTVDGVTKDISHSAMTAWSDSTTLLSSFTISAGRTEGQAQVDTPTYNLTSFGGKAISVTEPVENLIISSGTTKVPQGRNVTCQVDLTSIVGHNIAKIALAIDKRTSFSDFTRDRPISEVRVQPTGRGAETAPIGIYEVGIGYFVTFTNTTDADGHTSNIILCPLIPADFSLMYMLDSNVPQRISTDDYALQPDGSVPLPTSDTLYTHPPTTMISTAFYRVSAAAATEGTWKSLGACDPKDPSKRLTTQTDIVGSDGVKPGTYSVCTVVTCMGS